MTRGSLPIVVCGRRMAVYTRLQPGKYYVLEQRLDRDLTIRPVDLPAARE
jgi:hypothetical protein